MVTSGRGDLEVDVAAMTGGQIRQIRHRGKVPLHAATMAEKGYPRTGGSMVVEPGAHHFTLVGEPTATSVAMEGESGVGHWSPNTKQMVTTQVSLFDENTMSPAEGHVRDQVKRPVGRHSLPQRTEQQVSAGLHCGAETQPCTFFCLSH